MNALNILEVSSCFTEVKVQPPEQLMHYIKAEAEWKIPRNIFCSFYDHSVES